METSMVDKYDKDQGYAYFEKDCNVIHNMKTDRSIQVTLTFDDLIIIKQLLIDYMKREKDYQYGSGWRELTEEMESNIGSIVIGKIIKELKLKETI